MAQTPTCHDCAYAYFDRCQWMMTVGMGWPSRPVCANHPDSIGRTRPVPRGGVCRNFRAKAATPEGEVKQIPLGEGFYAYVDAADYEWLSQWTWRLHNGYAARREKSKLIFMHREIMQAPRGKVVDHKNRNKLDNTRRQSVGLHAAGEPAQQEQAEGSVLQVQRRQLQQGCGKWSARIGFEGRSIRLGYFTDEVEAAGRMIARRSSCSGSPPG